MDNDRELAILIVDDQAFIALNIEELARELGAGIVRSVNRLSDAIALVETKAWDAVFLDINLGGGQTSYPVAQRLRAKGIAFAFVTGSDDEFGPGYNDVPVLRKPFTSTALENCLKRLTRRGDAIVLSERRPIPCRQ
jgi:two-component SAPR family response regulator